MKICYVTNYLPGYHSHVGGAEQAILRIENLMKERLFETCFITLPSQAIIKNNSGNIKSIFTLENFLGIFGRYLEILKWYVFQFDPIAFILSKRFIIDTRPDVLHFGNFQFLTFGVLGAAKRLKIPVFVSVYDYWYFCPLTTLFDYKGEICRRFHGIWCVRCLPGHMRLIQVLLLMFRKKIFDFFLRKIDKFIVLSRSSEQILLDYGIEKTKISVIGLPAPHSFIKSRTEQTTERNSILFVGWLQKRKGLHILLEAMSLVWEKLPEIKLYIVTQRVKWEQEYENTVNSKIKNLPDDRYMFLLGKRKTDELKDLIQKASIVVVPEQWENMAPLIVIEAMLMSKAIVASNIGGIPEFIEHQKEGLLAYHLSPVDFAEKILYLLNNQRIAETFGKNAYQKILKMVDKNIIADRYVKEYEESCIS